MPFNAAVASDILQVNTSSLPNAFSGAVVNGQVLIAVNDCSQFTTFQMYVSGQYGAGAAPAAGVASMDFTIDWYDLDPIQGVLINIASDTFEIPCGVNQIGSNPTLLTGLIKGTSYQVRITALNVTAGGATATAKAVVNLSTIPVDKTRANFPGAGQDYITPTVSGVLAAAGVAADIPIFPLNPGSDVELTYACSAGTMQLRFLWGFDPSGVGRSFVLTATTTTQFFRCPSPNRPLLCTITNTTGGAGATYFIAAWSQSQ